MKMRCVILLLGLFVGGLAHAEMSYSASVSTLLMQLDSLVAKRDFFTQQKNEKIAQLHSLRKTGWTAEEHYWLNKNLYEEFAVYNADSAMVYADANLDIASSQGDYIRQLEWRINRSFLLAATGLLAEAQHELADLSGKDFPKELLVEYYGQMLYLYSHFSQYAESTASDVPPFYKEKERAYKDSINQALTSQDPLYLWYMGQVVQGTDSMTVFRDRLSIEVPQLSLNTRRDAMIAYALACLCRETGEQEEYLTNLIYSAMADVRISNKDIASLEELANVLFEHGDIDRAYTYMSYCQQNALAYRNRVRMVGISAVQDVIHRIYQERNAVQETRLRTYLSILSILSVVLLCAFFYIYRQMKRLKNSRQQLNDVNKQLNKHVEELSVIHRQMAEANKKLFSLNEQLKNANSRLQESNYVKEEYIGYVFSICSDYINKLDEYRKSINRKLKANRLDELKALTDTPSMAQNELKEFYRNFDTIFLRLYPTFVTDFNSLLHPDEQIVLKDGELLNTELRIYALVRLGITDSVKIADFLHYSPQTVYNNRLRARNKAIIPKESFAAAVRSLGKIQIE